MIQESRRRNHERDADQLSREERERKPSFIKRTTDPAEGSGPIMLRMPIMLGCLNRFNIIISRNLRIPDMEIIRQKRSNVKLAQSPMCLMWRHGETSGFRLQASGTSDPCPTPSLLIELDIGCSFTYTTMQDVNICCLRTSVGKKVGVQKDRSA